MSAQPWESLPEWAHIPKVGQAGLYCLHCHWVKDSEITPPFRKRTVAPRESRELGEQVGRCRLFPSHTVYWLLRDKP